MIGTRMEKTPRYVSIDVQKLALEVLPIRDGDSALEYLHGLAQGLAGIQAYGRGNAFGLEALHSASAWRERQKTGGRK